MKHDWKRQPGNTSIWRCVGCSRYTKANTIAALPTDACQRKSVKQFVNTNMEVFEQKIATTGRIGIIYYLRQHVLGCWDFSYDDRGVILLDGGYNAIKDYSFEEILEWIN